MNIKNMIDNKKQAAQLYADAWNTLDFSNFFCELHDDCKYTSQYVLEELDSKNKIIEYLSGKIQAVKNSGHKVLAKMATLNRGASVNPPPGSPCVAMYQGRSSEIAMVVLFEVCDDKICEIDICMPELYSVNIDD